MITDSSISHTDGAAVMALVGDLDVAVEDELHALVRQALGNPMTRRVVVDLSRVTFAGSTALGVLVALRLGARDVGVGFELRGANARIRRVIELTGLDGTFGLNGVHAS